MEDEESRIQDVGSRMNLKLHDLLDIFNPQRIEFSTYGRSYRDFVIQGPCMVEARVEVRSIRDKRVVICKKVILDKV